LASQRVTVDNADKKKKKKKLHINDTVRDKREILLVS